MVDFTPIITAVVTAVVGLAVWWIQELRKGRALEAQQDTIISKTMLVLLRNQLMAAHRAAVVNWEITIEEKNSFMEMHDLYIELGGKPPASRLINDLEKVKLVAD